ncbi:asparagine synthase (glutamine-hydrolyzing) [Streptosporangium sp. NPDC051022]|uniref:asparagine synthase (glutamine-hydrolyzing) n=1 Tax=Streptosporangium sp. NPDC051022 TaxID=3155752 RepID=UPI003443085A
MGADPSWPVPVAMTHEMSRRLRHRGPDETRTVDIPAGALISCRLAVLDPERSHQPLTDCSGAVTVVYSGEIYNYRELRRELSAAGHVFLTDGDGEVIPHLYEGYGTNFPERLRGAFAIAVYDRPADRLVLVRDRLGEKPLVYAVTGDRFLFASETRAIVPYTDGRISASAVHRYLHFGYVPEPSTVFEGIEKVPAGTVMVLDRAASLVPRFTGYWSPRVLEGRGGAASPRGRVAAMAESFSTAVGQQLNADVPAAVALSDGIDSTLLTEVAARCVPRPRTYSVAFDWMRDDRHVALADATARRVGASHAVIEISPARYMNLLVEGAAAQGEPIADWTMPAYLGMADRCREDGVRVLLTGHGPDELFLAYDWTRSALRSLGGEAAGEDGALHDAYRFNPEYREAVMLAGSLSGKYAPMMNGEAHPMSSVRGGRNARSDLRQRLVAGYLRSNGLMQLDGLGLLKEVEVRLPYVDHRFVEAAISADNGAAHDPDRPKALLYEMAAALGIGVRFTPKRPFFPDLRGVNAPVTALAESMLPSGTLVGDGVVPRGSAERLLGSVRTTGTGLNMMYRLLILELWLRHLGDPVGGTAGGLRG